MNKPGNDQPARNDAGQPTPLQKSRGETTPAQGDKQERALKQPHERDESASQQEADEPSTKRMGAIAHQDLVDGLVDTDKGPVLDATYDKVREGASQPVKQFRR